MAETLVPGNTEDKATVPESDDEEVSQEEYQSARQNLEKRVLEGPVAETFRGVEQYANDLGFENASAFIDFLDGKSVLDLGSGSGGLSKDLSKRGVQARVVSLNPRLSKTKFREHEKLKTQEELQATSLREIEEAQKAHDEAAVAAFGHALPYKSETFDVILDNWAISSYAHPVRDITVYEKSIEEMLRVLKPGGKVRIGDTVGYGWLEKGETGEAASKEIVLEEMGIDYQLLRDSEDAVIGVEIVKKKD